MRGQGNERERDAHKKKGSHRHTHTHTSLSYVCKHRVNTILLASIHPSIPCEDKARRENERCTVQLDTRLQCQSSEESNKYNGLCSKRTKMGWWCLAQVEQTPWRRVRAERLDSSADPLQLYKQLHLHNRHDACPPPGYLSANKPKYPELNARGTTVLFQEHIENMGGQRGSGSVSVSKAKKHEKEWSHALPFLQGHPSIHGGVCVCPSFYAFLFFCFPFLPFSHSSHTFLFPSARYFHPTNHEPANPRRRIANPLQHPWQQHCGGSLGCLQSRSEHHQLCHRVCPRLKRQLQLQAHHPDLLLLLLEPQPEHSGLVRLPVPVP